MLDDAVDCKIILVAAGSEWRPFLDSVPVFDVDGSIKNNISL
jgi:hypothetical protein